MYYKFKVNSSDLIIFKVYDFLMIKEEENDEEKRKIRRKERKKKKNYIDQYMIVGTRFH